MPELVKDEVGDGFGDARFLKGRHAERPVDLRFGHFEDAPAQEFEEKEVNLLRVGVFFLWSMIEFERSSK